MASYRSYLEQLAEEIQGYRDFNSRYTPTIDSYTKQYENFNNTNQNWKTAQDINKTIAAGNYFNPDTDRTYQQYKKNYVNNGLKAADDTLGIAAARTGGLASSYATSVAQQTYNNYMQQLANKIPELEQMARNRLTEDYNRYLGLSDKERAALLSNIDVNRGLRQDEFSQVYQTGYNRLKDAYGSYKSLEDLAMQDEALELQRQQIAAQQAAARAAASRSSGGSQTAVAAKEAPYVYGGDHDMTIGEWQAQQRINDALERANGWRPASEDDWEYHESNTQWGKRQWKKNKRTGEVVYL